MRILLFMLIPILMTVSVSSIAEQAILEGASKQVLKGAATSAAPSEAVEGAKSAGETVDKAKTLKGTTDSAPSVLKDQAQEAVKESAQQKLKEAVPEEAKQGVKAAEGGMKSAKKLKGQVETLPTSPEDASKAVKGKVKEEASKKALDMLH